MVISNMADLNDVLVDIESKTVLSQRAAQTLNSRELLFQESLGKQNVYAIQSLSSQDCFFVTIVESNVSFL
jgi:hypothetical protein